MKPENLLIVSDLHLSEGWLPDRGAYAAHEDFLFDHEFAAFLRHYTTAAPWKNRRWKLILNGDFMDFLQVNTVTGAPSGLKGLHDPYGLDCGRHETVWKLQRIHQGHPEFFQALAEFAWRHPVVIVKGNHDVEFTFEEVRQEFVRLLAISVGKKDPGSGPGDAQNRAQISAEQRLAAQVRFCEWIYYEPGCIYVEHGNQYESTNSFRFIMDPRVPGGFRRKNMSDEVELPMGSLFVRYFFNRIEAEHPHMDNVKPAEQFIKWYILNFPFKFLSFIFREGRLLVRHLQRMTQVVVHRGYLQRRHNHERQRDCLAATLGIDPATLAWIDSLKATPVLYRPGRIWDILLRALRLQLAYPMLTLWMACLGTLIAGTSLLVMVLLAYPFAARVFSALPFQLSPSWFWTVTVLDAVVLLPCAWVVAATLKQFGGADPMVDTLRRVSRRIARRLQVPLVVMGHTHHPEIRHYGAAGVTYVNTGTWTNVFDLDNRDHPKHQLHYLRVIRDEPDGSAAAPHQHADLLEWKCYRSAGSEWLCGPVIPNHVGAGR